MKKLIGFIGKAIAWVVCGFMSIIFCSNFPHWTSFLILLFVLILVPVDALQKLWSRMHIKGGLKVLILGILFMLALLNFPAPNSTSEALEPTQMQAEEPFQETKVTEVTEVTVQEEIETVPETTVIETTVEETEAETEPLAVETESEKLSVDIIAFMIEAVVADSFENYDLEYDDTGITVSVWDDGIALGASLASVDEEYKNQWNEMVDSFQMSADALYGFIQDSDHPELVLTYNLLNDQNKENVLLMYINGVLIYNAVG